jgi:hypothetical protein
MKSAIVPPIVHPDTVYTVEQLQAALRLRPSTVARECRLKRLRHSKRAGRIYVLGAWVLQWIIGGEVKRPTRRTR